MVLSLIIIPKSCVGGSFQPWIILLTEKRCGWPSPIGDVRDLLRSCGDVADSLQSCLDGPFQSRKRCGWSFPNYQKCRWSSWDPKVLDEKASLHVKDGQSRTGCALCGTRSTSKLSASSAVIWVHFSKPFSISNFLLCLGSQSLRLPFELINKIAKEDRPSSIIFVWSNCFVYL